MQWYHKKDYVVISEEELLTDVPKPSDECEEWWHDW